MTAVIRRVLACVLLLACVSVGSAGEPARKKPLTVADLYRLDAPGPLVLLGDGTRAVYERIWTDAKTRTQRHALWIVEGERAKRRPLEAGEPDGRSPVVSPDGRWIAFLSTRPRPAGWKQTPSAPSQSEAAVDLWLISVDGKTRLPLAGPDKPYGRVFHDGFYGHVVFAPDGKRLAFVADDGRDPRTPQERANGVRIVRPDQGEGYTGYGTAQIWVAHLDAEPGPCAARRIERLTDDDVWYGDPQWTPDGKTLVVTANKTADRESARYSINKDFDLYAIDVTTKAQRRLTTGPGPEVSPRVAPDGKTVVCLSGPRKGSHRDIFNLMIVALDGSKSVPRLVFDQHGPSAAKPAHLPATFPLPRACWERNEALYIRADQGTETRLVRVDVKTGAGTIVTVSARPEEAEDKSKIVQRLARQRQLAPPAHPFLRERLVAPTKLITWTSDGHTIEGLLTLPPAEVAKAPYKLLLHPHGGPHSRTARGFDFTVQLFAAHGYAVLQPNYRGSAGYGQKFIDADRYDFGGGDMRDCLAGADKLIADGLVDRTRQFVYGTSYGGFMTTWLVGHTKRFRAAAAQNAVTDLAMMWSLSDIPSWTEWEFGGRPWEQPERYRTHSPLTYADRVATPTLVLHSRDDRRCPLPMGQAFHQALRARGVPTEMVIYPGEGHGIRQPRHREDVLRRVLAWFEKHGSDS